MTSTDMSFGQTLGSNNIFGTQEMGMISGAASIIGGVVSVYNAIYGARIGREKLREKSALVKGRATQESIAASMEKERGLAGRRQVRGQIAEETAQAGQVRAQQQVRAAARGVQIGAGSAAEVTASTDLAKEIRKLSLDRAAHQKTADANIAAANMSRQSIMSRVQGANLDRSARGISTWMAGLSAAGQQAGNYFQQQSRRR